MIGYGAWMLEQVSYCILASFVIYWTLRSKFSSQEQNYQHVSLMYVESYIFVHICVLVLYVMARTKAKKKQSNKKLNKFTKQISVSSQSTNFACILLNEPCSCIGYLSDMITSQLLTDSCSANLNIILQFEKT